MVDAKMFVTWIFLLWIYIQQTDAAIYDLYNTKIATSDLRWTIEPRNSWEEVSGFDKFNNIIRSYQVCQVSRQENNNWIRSPFIDIRGAQRINIEIEFSIAKCDWPGVDLDYCRQTFNLFYYESHRDVASSTFPPWQEKPYIKIDTVAANSNDEINKKIFSIGPLKSTGGIYVAAQDQGACMSLISLRVYYYYCVETTRSLATFERTMTGKKTSSLVTVPGTCVANAESVGGYAPKHYCGSTGEWQIITGNCRCMAGYQPNSDATACLPCPIGTFKSRSGNGRCLKCPANSGPISDKLITRDDITRSVTKTAPPSAEACPCHPGFARAKEESSSHPCSKLPSVPRFESMEANATTATLAWKTPAELGGRNDLYYSILCETCSESSCQKCPEKVSYSDSLINHKDNSVSLSSLSKYYKNKIHVINLEPFTRYLFKIYSYNGLSSSSDSKPTFLLMELTTKESVPAPVANIYVADTSINSVMINWQVPSQPRGNILGYQVQVQRRDQDSRITRSSKIVLKNGKPSDPIVLETTKTSCTLSDLDSNTEYLVQIRAKTSVGFGRYSASVVFKTSKSKAVDIESGNENGTGILIAAVSTILVLAIVCSVLVFVYSRRRKSYNNSNLGKEKKNSNGIGKYDDVSEKLNQEIVNMRRNQVNKGQKSYVDYPDPLQAVQQMNKEISPLNLRLHDTIGEGEFAVVYRATMMEGGELKTVAAKQLKEGSSAKDQSNFLREACTMAQFNHPNILQLKGVVTQHKPEMIISEHLENGSLHQFLKRHHRQLTMPQLLQMLRGIANGMRYLSDMQFVHRDLAARNILVDSDFVCKVSDFGLSRTLENDPYATYTTQGGKIALRWTAPECIRFREFTSASDVWSFGIMMWEVMSYGEKPYWDMTNNDVMQSIGSGMRLPAPTNCPKALHQLMLECWSLDPKKRPTFAKIVSDLNKFIRHSSLLKVCSDDEMEQSVCCSPDVRGQIFNERYVQEESFIRDRSPCVEDDQYSESDSSSISQDDTCSSVIAAEERCLNV
uniref:ephrin type-A receptor 5-like n=1 Tax=Styela clava TaxID=7725 RepID=UPI00193989A0|nr:ephrin type-A receptor 5-like [Styela clava]